MLELRKSKRRTVAAVAMLAGIFRFLDFSYASEPELRLDPAIFYPIELTCPTGNTGDMILRTQNLSRESFWYSIRYVNKEPLIVKFGEYDGEKVQQYFSVNVKNPTDLTFIDAAEKNLDFVSPYYEKICLGSDEDKQKFFFAISRIRSRLSE